MSTFWYTFNSRLLLHEIERHQLYRYDWYKLQYKCNWLLYFLFYLIYNSSLLVLTLICFFIITKANKLLILLIAQRTCWIWQRYMLIIQIKITKRLIILITRTYIDSHFRILSRVRFIAIKFMAISLMVGHRTIHSLYLIGMCLLNSVLCSLVIWILSG